jgi:hypothetical protein
MWRNDSHQKVRNDNTGQEGTSTGLLLGFPFVMMISTIITIVTILLPAGRFLAAGVPLMLMLTSKNFRPLQAACLLGNLLMLFGSTGEVEYLGYLTITPSTPAFAISFSNVMAIAIYTVSRRSVTSRQLPSVQPTPSAVHVSLLVGSALFLLLRFTAGIPILQGDASRVSGLLTVNPHLGLVSGVFPIAASFLTSKKSKLVLFLKILMVILVLGTASRLLLGAVLVGLVTSSSLLQSRGSGKNRLFLTVAGILVLLSVTKVYAARTADGIQQVYENRIQNLGGIAGWISDLIGPSIFYAARNGLVVHEILIDNDITPPNGFISGGLIHALNLGTDPELWLTSAIGFNVTTVGAIATPIWSGAHADFGVLGGLVVASVIGLLLALVLRRVPNLLYWFSFGILLSFYGSYLVSLQFLAATIVVAIIVLWNNARVIGETSEKLRRGRATTGLVR